MTESYSVEARLSAVDNGFTSVMGSATKSLQGIDSGSQSATKSVGSFVLGLGALKVASAAFKAISNSMDAAITRFDTMQKYPKVMSALGFSTDDSSKSVKRLADGIDGLPTTLDAVVSTAQRMTAITGNMNKSTDATIALNNAMLASGASTEGASRGMEQYIQMLSTGKVDMQSWRTLQETMPIGLQKTAEAMGYVGETAQTDLYAALKDGKVTFKDFQNQLIELGTGTGELAKLAKVNSEGIATSFGNLKNAAAKGIATVIESVDKLTQKVTGKNIAQNLDSLKIVVNTTFSAIGTTIEKSEPIVSAFADGLTGLINVAKPLSPVIIGVGAAFATWKVISSINTTLKTATTTINAAKASSELLTLITQKQAAAQVTSTAATKADIAAKTIQNGQLTLGTAALGLFTGALSVSEVATMGMTAATTAFNAVLSALPLIAVAAGIGALVAGGIALWKHLNKDSEAVVKLKGKQEELLETSKDLAESTDQNAQNRKDEISSIENSSKSYQTLISDLERLSEKEKKTTGEKNKMKDMVEELNNSVAGLNLSYDAQNDALSQTPSKIQEQVAAFKELDKAAEAQQQLNDIIEERNTIEGKLSEINEQREKWNSTMAQSPIEAKKVGEAIKELDEQEAALKETQNALQTEFQNTSQVHEDAINNATAAVDAGVFKQQASYNSLNDTQKEVMDAMRSEYQSLQEKAGNAFDQIQQKSTISMEQMIENMQKNQEAIASWSQNIAALAEKGVDQGLLEQLRKMGPEGAAQAAELNTRSKEELEKLNETYRSSSESAMNAMKEGYQLSKHGVNEEVATIIPEAQATLQNQIAGANFGSVGSDMTDSMRAGIDSSKHQVADITGKMIDDAAETAKTKASTATFKDIGGQIPNGLKEGITSGKDGAEKAAGDLADGISTKAKDKLGVHSPSRVFSEIGSNVDQGLTDGINENKEGPSSAITSVAEGMITATQGLPDQMRSSGMNAMSGLANGIYEGSSGPLAAAQSIANQIIETINSALDIHSPSRELMATGEFATEGLEIGMLNNLSNLTSSAKKLSQTIVDSFSGKTGFGLASSLVGRKSSNLNLQLGENQTKSKQPMYVNLQIGNQNFKAFVEDISDAQGAKAELYMQI